MPTPNIPIIVPVAVKQWRPLAGKYAAFYCACGHTVTNHISAGVCLVKPCRCSWFVPILIPEEILATIWSESTGNPNAVNPSDPSWGLMQVTMFIAKEFAGVTDHAQLFDPDTNVKAGAGFLAYLKKRYAKTNPLADSNCAWIAAYNEGEPNLWHKRPDPGYVSAFVSHLKALGVAV